MTQSTNIYAVVSDSMVSCYGGLKVSLFRSGGDKTAECCCGKPISFEATQEAANQVVAAFCGQVCYQEHSGDFLHMPATVVSSTGTKEVRPACEECKGPAKGRGWDHKEGCSRIPKKVEYVPKPPCQECWGPARGRGHAHEDNCSLKSKPVVKEVKPPCTECGGPARGIGYTHQDGCSLKPKPKPRKPYVPTGRPRGRPKGRRRRIPAGV